jgi:putative (di)nucleoside polyphosphate hydrolase
MLVAQVCEESRVGGMHEGKDQYFRASAGIVLLNEREEVLAIERRKIPGAWQLPQGGIRMDEEPKEAAKRELSEETNLNASRDARLVGELPEWTAYELPAADRGEKTAAVKSRGGSFFGFYPMHLTYG